MHKTSYDHMRTLLHSRLSGDTSYRIVDVGSQSVNKSFPHTYRDHMKAQWNYTGVDIAPGQNVDVVMVSAYTIPLPNQSADVVISGQCLEHVRNPFKLTREMARLLKPGGQLYLTAPAEQRIHRYPIDCWRILPDGMRSLIDDAALDFIEAYCVEHDCWGLARKPN